MTWQAWFTIAVVVALVAVLATTNAAIDMVFMAALTALLVAGVLNVKEAFSGFSNESMLAIGVIYVMVAGLRDTGGVTWLAKRIFGKPKSVWGAQMRVTISTAIISAWIYDNPLVAMLLPTVDDWGKKHRIPASKILIPLSYGSLVGGAVTLIGTSTNLIVDGLLRQNGLPGFGMFEFTIPGLLVGVVAIATMALTMNKLLPDRQAPLSIEGDVREYTAEVIIDPKGPLAGRTIEEAGLRNLHGMYIVEVQRGATTFPVVAPHFQLEGNDRLILVGIVSSVVDLHKIHGLLPAGDQVFKLDHKRPNRILIEAVVSNSCPLIGMTVREGRFRNVYNAVVIAVARNGERLSQKIGDVVLEPGDTLLLEARASFAHQQRNSRDFYLVSAIPDSNPPRHEKSVLSVLIVLGMILLATFKVFSLLTAALLAAGVMIGTKCCSVGAARKNVDWSVLIVIACSLGLSAAMEKTGAGAAISSAVTGLAGTNPILNLAVIYLLTTLFTEVLSHHAAAAVMFPIAIALSTNLHVNNRPFVVAIVLATALGFATPIAHQTNLMVYGPGGYKFSDYMRLGLILDVVCGIVAVLLIPVFIHF